MPQRPLHAVVLPHSAAAGPVLDAVAAALDGTGPAILPLDPALPAARLRELLDAFAPSAVITPEGTQPRAAPADRPGAGRPGAGRPGADRPGADRPGADRPGAGRPGAGPDIAAVIATSGSTGTPKGVALSAAALRASAASSMARIGAGPGQRWLCCLPFFHVAGLQVLVRSLLAGVPPLVSERADPGVVAQAAGLHVSLVPTQLRRLLDAGAPLDGLGTILLGGAAAPAGLVEAARAAGARVVTTYGMSETCGGCVYDGLPLDGVRVELGDGGLIRIAGPMLFSGYWPGGRLPAGASGSCGPAPGSCGPAAAGDGGWFTTSDLGSLDVGGRLTVRGRADDVINTGGEKVLPGEVESVLGTMTGVRDVVVIGSPDPEWGELVTAIVVPADPAAPPDLSVLRASARGRLPGYAAPRRLVLVPEIPLLASGKPDRQALRSQAPQSQAPQSQAPQSQALRGGARAGESPSATGHRK